MTGGNGQCVFTLQESDKSDIAMREIAVTSARASLRTCLAAGGALFAVCVSLPALCRELPLDTIRLPPGFRISLYADNVPGARSMTLGPDGTLFVGTRGDRVYALPNHKRGARADEVITLASGLKTPNGVAFHDGALYVAEINRILRFDDIESRLRNPPKPVIVNDRFPTDTITAGNSSASAQTACCMCRSARRATSARRTRRAMPQSFACSRTAAVWNSTRAACATR